jgi:predicted nucleic acid-binding protein
MGALLAGQWGKPLLLEYVFLEVVTVLMIRLDASLASSVARTLLQAREVEFGPCSNLFLDVLEVFLDQRSSRLSFTDAAIVTLARDHEPGFVATFDRGFEGLPGVTVVKPPRSAT